MIPLEGLKEKFEKVAAKPGSGDIIGEKMWRGFGKGLNYTLKAIGKYPKTSIALAAGTLAAGKFGDSIFPMQMMYREETKHEAMKEQRDILRAILAAQKSGNMPQDNELIKMKPKLS